MVMSASRASGVSGSLRFSCFSARSSSASIAASSSRRNVSTLARDSSAELSSKDGFSVVAPTRMMVPSSICGRKASCCERLKRWISSTNSSVPRPSSRRARAASNTLRKSETPEWMAESCSKWRSVTSAKSRATVVLPVPGGPQKITDDSRPALTMRDSMPCSPNRWSWPITSASAAGRNRSASGRGAPSASPAASNSDTAAFFIASSLGSSD